MIGNPTQNPGSQRDHLKWAYEALFNYAAYRVQGDASGKDHSIPLPPDWPKDQIPLLSDLWAAPEAIDFEYTDYLLVRQCIAVQVRDNPQDANLPEFLTHCLYYRKPVGEFAIFMPFASHKVTLASLDKSVAVNAWYAVAKLTRNIAREKEKLAEILAEAS